MKRIGIVRLRKVIQGKCLFSETETDAFLEAIIPILQQQKLELRHIEFVRKDIRNSIAFVQIGASRVSGLSGFEFTFNTNGILLSKLVYFVVEKFFI